MPRIDRYLLSQFLQLFGFFALVLVGVYWINKAVDLFDQLIGDGQSGMVFVEFSLLTLPTVIKLVLPIAAFVATVYGTNRLITESELVVMQATGFSSFRLARPVLYFGLLVGLMMSLMGHFLVPASRNTLAAARATMSENVTARYLTPGQFAHPSDQVTLYIRDISPKGELLDLFLSDARSPTETTIYTARTALFVRGDAGPKLIMFNGMAQELDAASQLLSVTRFADFTFDIGGLLTTPARSDRSMAELTTPELLWPTPALEAETGQSAGRLRFEGHNRFAEPMLAVSVTLIGFSSLLVGGFSRFGLWRQIAMAVGLLVLVQGLSTSAADLGARVPQGYLLAYVAPVVGLFIALGLLWWVGRPRRVGRVMA
ncbi:LPS export ABC transporter permease LptF [bacterium]|nr:LPS export ABC transporter permease LptF [bacterium]